MTFSSSRSHGTSYAVSRWTAPAAVTWMFLVETHSGQQQQTMINPMSEQKADEKSWRCGSKRQWGNNTQNPKMQTQTSNLNNTSIFLWEIMKTGGILHLFKHVTESATQRLSHTRATRRVRKCRSGGTRTDMNLHKEQLPGGDLRLLQTALSSPPVTGAVPRSPDCPRTQEYPWHTQSLKGLWLNNWDFKNLLTWN